MSKKLTYSNVFAMLEKMEENAEYHRSTIPMSDRETRSFIVGQINAINRIKNEFVRAQDGWSTMLGSVRTEEVA